jgi:hypothetical protein
MVVMAELGANGEEQQQQEQPCQAGPSVSYEEQQQQYAAWYAMLGMEHYQYYVDWYAQSAGLVGMPDTWAPEQLEAFNGWYGSHCWQQFQQQYGYDQQQQEQQQQGSLEEQGQERVEGQDQGSTQVEQQQVYQQVQEEVEVQKESDVAAAAAGAAEGGDVGVVTVPGAVVEEERVVVRGRKSEEERVIGELVEELHEEVSQQDLGEKQQVVGLQLAPLQEGEHQQGVHGALLAELAEGDGWEDELQMGVGAQEGQGQETLSRALAQGAFGESFEVEAAGAVAVVPAVAVATGVVDTGARVSESSGWGSQPSTAKVAEGACKQIMATALARVLAEESSGEGAGEGWGLEEVDDLTAEANRGEGKAEAEKQQGQLVAALVIGENGDLEVHGNGHVEAVEMLPGAVQEEGGQQQHPPVAAGGSGVQADQACPGE